MGGAVTTAPVGEGARLGAWTTTEAAGALADSIVLLPLGSLEQHGPHLPLSTDTAIAEAVAHAAAARNPRLLVAPAVAYGASGEHAGFAGTLSIGEAALTHLLVELARSAEGVRLCLVNGHGGNERAVRRAALQLSGEGRPVLRWSVGGATARVAAGIEWPGGGPDAHAGLVETSLMLAVRAGEVRLAEAVAGDRRPLSELIDDLVAGGVAAVSRNGVLGDPAGASAELGRALLDALAADLLEVVDRALAGSVGGGQ